MSATHPKLARRARLQFDEREQKHMILYPERGLVLNATAAAVVALCDGTRTEGEIVDALAAANSDVPRDRIFADVHVLIAQLADKGLVE